MANKSHDAGVTMLDDGFAIVECLQSKLHETVPVERISGAISTLDDDCETEHTRVDL